MYNKTTNWEMFRCSDVRYLLSEEYAKISKNVRTVEDIKLTMPTSKDAQKTIGQNTQRNRRPIKKSLLNTANRSEDQKGSMTENAKVTFEVMTQIHVPGSNMYHIGNSQKGIIEAETKPIEPFGAFKSAELVGIFKDQKYDFLSCQNHE